MPRLSSLSQKSLAGVTSFKPRAGFFDVTTWRDFSSVLDDDFAQVDDDNPLFGFSSLRLERLSGQSATANSIYPLNETRSFARIGLWIKDTQSAFSIFEDTVLFTLKNGSDNPNTLGDNEVAVVIGNDGSNALGLGFVFKTPGQSSSRDMISIPEAQQDFSDWRYVVINASTFADFYLNIDGDFIGSYNLNSTDNFVFEFPDHTHIQIGGGFGNSRFNLAELSYVRDFNVEPRDGFTPKTECRNSFRIVSTLDSPFYATSQSIINFSDYISDSHIRTMRYYNDTLYFGYSNDTTGNYGIEVWDVRDPARPVKQTGIDVGEPFSWDINTADPYDDFRFNTLVIVTRTKTFKSYNITTNRLEPPLIGSEDLSQSDAGLATETWVWTRVLNEFYVYVGAYTTTGNNVVIQLNNLPTQTPVTTVRAFLDLGTAYPGFQTADPALFSPDDVYIPVESGLIFYNPAGGGGSSTFYADANMADSPNNFAQFKGGNVIHLNYDLGNGNGIAIFSSQAEFQTQIFDSSLDSVTPILNGGSEVLPGVPPFGNNLLIAKVPNTNQLKILDVDNVLESFGRYTAYREMSSTYSRMNISSSSAYVTAEMGERGFFLAYANQLEIFYNRRFPRKENTSYDSVNFYLVDANGIRTDLGAVSQVSEGDEFAVGVTHTNNVAGAQIGYEFSGSKYFFANSTASVLDREGDLLDTPVSPKFISTANEDIIYQSVLLTDNLSEGTETLTVTLEPTDNRGVATNSISGTLSILDTSTGPNYQDIEWRLVDPQTGTIGTTEISTAREGDRVAAVLITQGVATNTTIGFVVISDTDSNDWTALVPSDALDGTGIITIDPVNNETVAFVGTVRLDQTSEGDNYITIRLANLDSNGDDTRKNNSSLQSRLDIFEQSLGQYGYLRNGEFGLGLDSWNTTGTVNLLDRSVVVGDALASLESTLTSVSVGDVELDNLDSRYRSEESNNLVELIGFFTVDAFEENTGTPAGVATLVLTANGTVTSSESTLALTTANNPVREHAIVYFPTGDGISMRFETNDNNTITVSNTGIWPALNYNPRFRYQINNSRYTQELAGWSTDGGITVNQVAGESRITVTGTGTIYQTIDITNIKPLDILKYVVTLGTSGSAGTTTNMRIYEGGLDGTAIAIEPLNLLPIPNHVIGTVATDSSSITLALQFGLANNLEVLEFGVVRIERPEFEQYFSDSRNPVLVRSAPTATTLIIESTFNATPTVPVGIRGRTTGTVTGVVSITQNDATSWILTVDDSSGFDYRDGLRAGESLDVSFYGYDVVTNGTFESDTAGWTTSGVGTSSYNSGAQTVTVDDGDSGEDYFFYQELTVQPGYYQPFVETVSESGNGILLRVYNATEDSNTLLAALSPGLRILDDAPFENSGTFDYPTTLRIGVTGQFSGSGVVKRIGLLRKSALADTNIVTNGNFADGGAGWTNNAGTVDYTNGTALFSNVTGQSQIFQGNTAGGILISYTAYIKVVQNTSTDSEIWIFQNAGSPNTHYRENIPVVTLGNPLYIETTFTLDSTLDDLFIILRAQPNPGGGIGTTEFDDVILVRN